MSERKQNWYTRFVKWFGPGLYLESGNPTMGIGGASAFSLFSSTKLGRKFSLGMKESGIVSLNADSTLEIIAGEENDDGGEDILIHSRNGAIDIKVNKNGDVRIYGSNVSIKAEAAIDLNARVIRLKGDDEISLQAPKIWSQGKKGNLVPKTWTQSCTFGSFIGADKLSGFIEKGLQEAAGLTNAIDDLQPEFTSLAGKAGDLAKGLGDQLPGMADQLTGQLSGVTDQLSSLAETTAPQLQSIAEDLAPQLQAFAEGPGVELGETLQGSVSNFQNILQQQSGVFANLGDGLKEIKIPKGY